MKILLCCSGGFSSSIIAQAVVDAGKNQGSGQEKQKRRKGNEGNVHAVSIFRCCAQPDLL